MDRADSQGGPSTGSPLPDFLRSNVGVELCHDDSTAEVTDDRGVDIAVWTQDLQEAIGNPILIEIKTKIQNLQQVDATVGRMIRALEGIPNGFGIIMYKDAVPSLGKWKYPPWTLPITFTSVAGFLKALRGNKFANLMKMYRNYTVVDE